MLSRWKSTKNTTQIALLCSLDSILWILCKTARLCKITVQERGLMNGVFLHAMPMLTSAGHQMHLEASGGRLHHPQLLGALLSQTWQAGHIHQSQNCPLACPVCLQSSAVLIMLEMVSSHGKRCQPVPASSKLFLFLQADCLHRILHCHLRRSAMRAQRS